VIWEYKSVRTEYQSLVAVLNEAGQDGWEVVAVFGHTGAVDEARYVVTVDALLKRDVEEESLLARAMRLRDEMVDRDVEKPEPR